MFQAELRPARLLKQIIDALKEVVVEVQFECSASKMQVQAMDSSHVSLVALELRADKFQTYRCEKPVTLGMNVGNLAKMLKCAGNDDIVCMKCDPDGDTLNIRVTDGAEERTSEFSMKLIEIDGDALGIPQQDYAACVQMPSAEFTRICRDIASFGDTVTVDVRKDRVSFAAQGDIGTGKMVLKAQRDVDVKPAAPKDEAPAKKEQSEAKNETPVKKEEPEAEGGAPGTKEKEEHAKDEVQVKKEDVGDDKKAPAETKPEAKEEKPAATKPEVKDDDDSDDVPAKKRRRVQKGEKEEKPPAPAVRIECSEPVVLQFALRYLTLFSKAQSVSDMVRVRLAKDVPLSMEYEIAAPEQRTDAGEGGGDARLGTLRYYLAPKVGDGDGDGDEAGAPAAADDE